MSFVTRQAAHCDQCSHEWLVVGASTPTHCAKCKSRRWNFAAGFREAGEKLAKEKGWSPRKPPPVDVTPSYYVPAKYKTAK